MKLQFSVVYSLSHQNPFQRYSTGIELMIFENDSALDKHARLLKAIVETHNSTPLLIKAAGLIKFEDVCVNCAVRLD